MRQIVLDIETTGFRVEDGNRIIEVGCVELLDGKPTGKIFHSRVNPERDVPEVVRDLTGLDRAMLANEPLFCSIAQKLSDFIGGAEIVITCREDRKDKSVLDIAFLTKELRDAGIEPPRLEQWLNVRKWAEAMFGDEAARLDNLLDRYGVSREERDRMGHGALLDAQLLASIYPRLQEDYARYLAQGHQPVPRYSSSPAGAPAAAPGRKQP